MDLRQLHALLAVAEHRSFSAAARSLHTVQSNVSTHVARLEKELGSTLIDRTRGDLTPEGEIVASRARRVIGELRSIEADLTSLRDDVSGRVRIGIIGTTALWLVAPLLESLRDNYPLISAVVIEATTTSLLPHVVAERLDVAVVNLPLDDPDVDTRPLFDEDRVVIAPDGHPLASYERVTVAELAEYPILLPPSGTAFRDEVDADAQRVRTELSPQAEVDGLRLLTSLAFSGYGAALVPASAAPPELEGKWKRVAVDGISQRSVGLAVPRRSPPSAPTRVVIESIASLVTELGAGDVDIVPNSQPPA